MKFLCLFAFTVIISSCSSQKITNTIGPFTGDYQPFAQSWTGGIPGSGSGINLFLPLFDADKESVEIVYYKGMTTTVVEISTGTPRYTIARFSTNFNTKPDMNMNLDPKKEYGNASTKNEEKFPFDLEDDEAIVKFVKDGKFTFTKIKGVQKKSAMDLPSKPQ
ncbi:hypothetical protein [Nonlabens antarcticus]|uniref:hypothetical protein n=1 Tax=Nonlabens antarcticus TaxID=392714 RepID=UPI001890BEBD|nr:hypothetical protein [Nonlabens antarcticus]